MCDRAKKLKTAEFFIHKDFEKYFDQTAAYALGLGKKIGVLCYLNPLRKTPRSGAPEDDIDTFVHQTGRSSTANRGCSRTRWLPQTEHIFKGSREKNEIGILIVCF